MAYNHPPVNQPNTPPPSTDQIEVVQPHATMAVMHEQTLTQYYGVTHILQKTRILRKWQHKQQRLWSEYFCVLLHMI